MSRENKIKKYEDGIYPFAFMAAGIGPTGVLIPGIDLAGVSGIWVGMIMAIAAEADRQLDEHTVGKFVSGILAGSAGYLAGSRLFQLVLHAVPGVGTLGAMGINCFLNFIYTIRLGRYVALQMDKPEFDTQDWADLIPQITSVVFHLPSAEELRQAWEDWNNKQ